MTENERIAYIDGLLVCEEQWPHDPILKAAYKQGKRDRFAGKAKEAAKAHRLASGRTMFFGMIKNWDGTPMTWAQFWAQFTGPKNTCESWICNLREVCEIILAFAICLSIPFIWWNL
jgi:hypothetical protein